MNKHASLASLLGMAVALGVLPSSAAAQNAAALNPLTRATTDGATGLALARRQIAAGELTAALATIERVILTVPRDAEARLLHAGLLCRLDDRAGSLPEFDRLRGRDFPPELWREATGPCESRR